MLLLCQSLFLEEEHEKGALSVESDKDKNQAVWVRSDRYSQILGKPVTLHLWIWVKVWTLEAMGRQCSDLCQREVSAESECSLACWKKGDTLK